MDNKEAIKYLIPPIATSTEPSAEYLKQKEAYDLAIKALERPKGEWIRQDDKWIQCSNCKDGLYGISITGFEYCPFCGADMKGGAENDD